jgi:O-antigen/teichoic acid export membrane protein
MPAPARSLRQSAQQAILWSGGMNVLRDVLQFGQMIILARLLDPAVYGLAVLATAFVSFAGFASFQHVVAHILQQRDGDAVDYDQHFTFGLMLNGSLFVLANAAAFVAASASATYAQAQPLIHILSLSLLLSVPADLRIKMLERENLWARVRSLQMAGIVISIGSAIALAWAGFGVYALVLPGLLASCVLIADLFVAARWRPHWRWDRRSYAEALRFGASRGGSNAMNGARVLLQHSLITQHFGFTSLGLFNRADGLANLFCGRLAQEAAAALYPVITRAESASERFRRISGLVLQAVMWTVTPIAVLLSFEAHEVVRLLYGDKWLQAVPLVPLAMGLTLLVSAGATAHRLLLANDQHRLCLRSDVFAALLTMPVMVALVPLGVVPYLWGANATAAVIAVVLLALLVKSGGIDARSIRDALLAPAVGAAAAMLVLAATPRAAPAHGVAQILFSAVLLAATYVAALRLFFRPELDRLLHYLPFGPRLQHWLRTAPRT